MSRRGRYPNLRDYLQNRADIPPITRNITGWMGAIGFPAAFFGSLYMGGSLGWPMVASILFAAFIAIPIMLMIIGMYSASANQPKNDKERFIVGLRTHEKNLLNWAKRKSRERDPRTMALLEFAATQLERIQEALGRPVWFTDVVETSWKDWRTKTLDTSQVVMDELIYNSRDLLKAGNYEKDLDDDDDDDEDEESRFMQKPEANMPARYQKLAKLANDMKALADAASTQADDLSAARFISAGNAEAAIDSTLADLENLRSAHAELGDFGPQTQEVKN